MTRGDTKDYPKVPPATQELGASMDATFSCSPMPLSRHLRTSDPVIIRFTPGDRAT